LTISNDQLTIINDWEFVGIGKSGDRIRKSLRRTPSTRQGVTTPCYVIDDTSVLWASIQ